MKDFIIALLIWLPRPIVFILLWVSGFVMISFGLFLVVHFLESVAALFSAPL